MDAIEKETKKEIDKPINFPSTFHTVYLRNNLWIPPVCLILVLLSFLIYLLIPGSLIHTQQKPTDDLFGINQNDLEVEVENSLRLRLADLETALETGTCSAGVFEFPNDSVALFPPVSGGDAASNSDKQALIMPPVSELNVEFSDENLSLDKLIRKSTVFIFYSEGDSTYTGTGFFVNRNFIVTNSHVIEGQPQNIRAYVDGEKEPIVLTIKKKSLDFEKNGRDYAVLMSSVPSDFFLTFQSYQGSAQLQPVIAAGFPGDAWELMESLKQSETSDNIDKAPFFITTGIVNAEQKIKNTENAIIHSATSSQGNSGGPLANACGRVLGINTFTSSSEVRTLNIALSGLGLMQFLSEAQVDFSKSTEVCRPSLIQPNLPPDQ